GGSPCVRFPMCPAIAGTSASLVDVPPQQRTVRMPTQTTTLEREETPMPKAATPEKLDARADAFNQFIDTQQKAEPGSVFRLDDPGLLDVEAIPTGVVDLDIALGVGGLPRGRIVELYGPHMSGKSSLSLQVCAMAQALC